MPKLRASQKLPGSLNGVKWSPLAVLDAGEEVTAKAAQLKAGHGLPYTDCFAAATTTKDEVLVTSIAKDREKIPGLRILPLPEHKRKS
ncbi:MAG TPA: hypothetical protein VN833_12510 [Candidatus Acidoferrales bacterium]|nr:hypothetical protein [Candidatus Acidoferrales bacterium]